MDRSPSRVAPATDWGGIPRRRWLVPLLPPFLPSPPPWRNGGRSPASVSVGGAASLPPLDWIGAGRCDRAAALRFHGARQRDGKAGQHRLGLLLVACWAVGGGVACRAGGGGRLGFALDLAAGGYGRLGASRWWLWRMRAPSGPLIWRPGGRSGRRMPWRPGAGLYGGRRLGLRTSCVVGSGLGPAVWIWRRSGRAERVQRGGAARGPPGGSGVAYFSLAVVVHAYGGRCWRCVSPAGRDGADPVCGGGCRSTARRCRGPT